MIDMLDRARSTTPVPLRPPRRRQKSRDEDYRARRRKVYQDRINDAETPTALISAALDYLRSNLMFVRDPQRRWRIAEQVAQAIVRAADDLDQEVTRGGNRDRVDQPA